MKFLKKIQELPEKKRRIIFWILISTFTIILMIFYVKISKERIKNINIEEIQNELPKWEPEIFAPGLKELEKLNIQEELEKLNIQEELEKLNIEEEITE